MDFTAIIATIKEFFLGEKEKTDEEKLQDSCGKEPSFSGGSSKLTDQSAAHRAKAMTYYACAYNHAMKQQSDTQFNIGMMQMLASLIFANLQYKSARQLQDRLDEIWYDLKGKGGELYDHWKNNARPIEVSMLQEARARERAGYPVDYDTVINRTIAKARSEYSRARDKVDRENSIHCVGSARLAKRQLYAAEARAVVLATNSAIRYEEERKHRWEKEYREEELKILSLFQSRISQGIGAIGAAMGAATTMGAINPWEGFTQSVAQMSNLGNMYSSNQMAGFNMNNSGLMSSLTTNHF